MPQPDESHQAHSRLSVKRPALPAHHLTEHLQQAITRDTHLVTPRQNATPKVQIIPILVQQLPHLFFAGCQAHSLKQFNVLKPCIDRK